MTPLVALSHIGRVRIVREMLGHASIVTTDLHTLVRPRGLREATEKHREAPLRTEASA